MLAAAHCYEYLRGMELQRGEISPTMSQPLGLEGPID
jgi:hypothetical protein